MYVFLERLEPMSHVVYALHETQFVSLRMATIPSSEIEAYIVDKKNLEDFRARRSFLHQGPGRGKSIHGTFPLPHPGNWWLVVMNLNDYPVEIGVGHHGL